MSNLFDYLLNAFEEAAQSPMPASLGYADKRRKLIEYVRDLERKTLSPEDTAIKSIIHELAAIADACADLHQNRNRANSDPVMTWDTAKLTLGTLRKARWIRDGSEPQIGGSK